MKNLSILVILAILSVGLFSCGDNDVFSNMHELTEDEIAEIARQDSIEQAQKESINADLILEYSLDITISGSLYDGGTLEIELDKIAEKFGISEEELIAGIAGESGAPDVKGFAIAGTTHADIAGASNTNAPWGHWWDRRGDLTSWGDSAMVFAEFYTEDGFFTIGQYPGHLTAGQQVTFIEALKYNEIRVAVKITVNAVAPGQVNATVVSTQDLTVDATLNADYATTAVEFDLDKVLNDLGISSMDEVAFIGVNEDGSYATEAVTGNGFWYDVNGYVGAWGDGASVFTNYGDYEDNMISIGQYPGLTVGDAYTIKYGFLAGNKIVMLNITVTIVGYIDPETAPEGDPEDVTVDITLTKPYTNDYSSVTEDIKETLRQAFKMTTYQIHSAIQDGTLKLYQGAVSEEDPSYTADVPGYWLNADGAAVGWADGIVWTSIGHNETELYLYGGNHPDNATAGSTVSTTYIAVCNGGSVTINLNFVIEEGTTEEPKDLTLTYDVSFPADTVNYSGTTVSLSDNGDIDKVAEALLLDVSAIETAFLEAKETPADGKIAFAAVEPDESLNYNTTANGYGFWFDSTGATIGWGGDNDSKLFSEFSLTELTFSIGQFPGKSTAGDTYTVKEAFVYMKGGVEYQVTFVFNVTIN